MQFLLGVAALFIAFWKSLGKLAWPFCRKWLSRGPSFGFSRLVTLQRTALRDNALQALSDALGGSLPFKAAAMDIGYISLSLGFVVGVRLYVQNVTLVLERLPEEVQWQGGEETARSEVLNQSSAEAKKFIGLVEKAKKPRPPGGFLARILEMFIAGTKVSVEEFQIIFQDPLERQELCVGLCFHLRTSRSWKIEFRGTHLVADAKLRISSGGEELLTPLKLSVDVHLPKVLRTLLVPMRLPKKTAIAEVLVDDINLQLRPKSMVSLTNISDTMSRFGAWKKDVVESVERIPLTAVELRNYLDAVKGRKKDLSEWEQRMTSKEIVNARCSAEAWPVPTDLTVEAWLDQLAEEQRPLRSLNAKVDMASFTAEVLQEHEMPGMGCSLRLKNLKLGAATTDPDMMSNSRETDAFLLAVGEEADGPMPKMKATVQLESMQIECEALGTQAASVLQPCSIEMKFAKYPSACGEDLHLKFQTRALQGQSLTATLSSRAVWRLQRALRNLSGKAIQNDLPAKGGSTASVQREVIRPRRHADTHLEKVRSLFQRLDHNQTGTLQKQEVMELLENMYIRFMTPKEIEIAAEHLVSSLGENKELSFPQLEEFFLRAGASDAAKGQVCLQLHELTKPIPAKLQVHEVWSNLRVSVENSKTYSSNVVDLGAIAAATLQLYWVRTLQNYKEAKRLWKEKLAPSLEPHFRPWMLRGDMPALDVWSDPAISLRSVLFYAKEGQDTTMNVEISMDGLSVRLAETQHASSVPSAKLDLADLHLTGGLYRAATSNSFVPLESGFHGRLQLSAEYWNERIRITEPFVEPWRLRLQATPSRLLLRAEEHLVLNLTPPLLQALTVASNALASAKEDAFDVEHSTAPVAVWVYNRTLCDVRVAARNPEGERSTPVEISRWAMQEPVAVELATSSTESPAVGTSRWVLEMELRGGDADSATTGTGWWVRQELPFSTSGRRLVSVGHRHLLCVSFSVDVRTLAPVVSLSGIGVLENMTSRSLTVNLGKDGDGNEQTVDVEPYQSWQAGIGGGYEVTMPLDKLGHLKAKLPLDSEPLDDREKLLERFAGYRFVLLAHEGRPKGELRDRVVVCVPMLSVLNALPCQFECSVRNVRKHRRRRRNNNFLMAGDPSQQGQPVQEPDLEVSAPEAHSQTLTPGLRLGFNDVDPDLAVEVVLKLAGFTYRSMVPAKCLKSKLSVKRAISHHPHWHLDLTEAEPLQLKCDDTSAPKLAVDLEWEMHGAVFLVYSSYWVADKTGWGLDVLSVNPSTDRLELSEQARPSPVPASGAWKALGVDQLSEDIIGRTPHLALMDLRFEQIQVRLLEGGCKNLSGWFWNPSKPSESLKAWWGAGAAAAKATPGVDETAEEEGPTPAPGAPLEETGWSGLLSVGILGSTGVAELPTGGILSKYTSTATEVGVSVAGLPAPFERTKLVTVVPRYLVRNQLPFSLELWPSRGSGKQAPKEGTHLIGTWKVEPPSECEMKEFSLQLADAEDSLFYESNLEDGATVRGLLERKGAFLQGEMSKNADAFGEVRIRFRQGALRLSRREGEGEWTEELRYHSQDARACCNPVLEPGQTMSIGGIPSENWAILAMTKDAHLNPILSFRVSGEADAYETRWSHQVPLSAVGDSVIALQRVDGESEPLLVRASIQLEGAMLFLVLSRGQWPFEIENRSSQHTVVFHQEGTDLDKEWVMRPREVRRFVFPDPEKPKTLQGRILGAGAELAVRYQLDNISAGGAQQKLWIPGRSKAALLATLLLRGSCRRLVLCDQESVGPETDGVIQADVVIQDQASVVNRMAFDVFFAGLHVCLADTLKSVPEELLAFTVDYIQLNKPSNERSLHLTVHHIQLDDFGDQEYFLLGPLDSGFNSRTLPLSDAEDFFAVPLLSLTLQGDRSTNMFDSLHRAITLKTFGVALRPMEARVDVPRLLYVAARLKGWTSSLDQQGLAADNIELLDRVLMTSFQMPSTGQTTCSVGLLQAQAISLNLELKLTQRKGDVKETSDFSGDTDLAAQLRKQGSRFGALRPIIEFFGRLGASFADVAPRFRFDPLLITDASADLPVLQSAVARHYIQQLLQQSARLLGSLQLLGDPANLMDEIGSGVMSFFSKTKEEVLGQRAGLGSGVSDLTESIVGGALQSFAKMSGSLKDTVGSSLGQPIGSDRKALSLSEGLDLGYASIAVGLSEGISSVVKEPLKQANEDGLVGLASGTALGAASMVVRPLEGLLGAAEKIAQGAEGAVRGRFRGFCGLRRPPRAEFHQEATGLRPLAQSFFWPMWLMTVNEISLPSLWLERSVQSLVVYLRSSSGHHDMLRQEVHILRSHGRDRWCAEADRSLAVGRVGQLRGPSAICIDAVLQTNLEFAEPSRAAVAVAEMEGEALEKALMNVETMSLTLELKCIPNSSIASSDGSLGRIKVSLAAALDRKIMPVCFMPEQVEEGCARVGPAKAANLEKALEDIHMTQLVLAIA